MPLEMPLLVTNTKGKYNIIVSLQDNNKKIANF